MIVLESTVVIWLAFILDLFFGDPRYRLHPIRVIGQCVTIFTGILRRAGLDGKGGGILLVLIVQSASVGTYLVVRLVAQQLHLIVGLGFDLFICYSCLALKDLMEHAKRVVLALEAGNLPEARKRIAMVVGRDVRWLDEKGVSRAALETQAENFVDGFLSPLFWYMTGAILACYLGVSPVITGVSLMLAFKVASTLDSMVGYRTPEFLNFGRAGARLDDVMNFVPARLSVVILFAGALISGVHPLDGIRVAFRDRLKHESPNAGHPESFVAGALHVSLGGPTRYPDGIKDKPWLGEGRPDAGPEKIRTTNTLLIRSGWIAMVFFSAASILLV